MDKIALKRLLRLAEMIRVALGQQDGTITRVITQDGELRRSAVSAEPRRQDAPQPG
jgi:hypothetical protein